jgi:serine phosphatase RsbU (regulator of sigma subunit)
MFVTLVYLLLDIETGQICFSNAGHASPIFVDAQGAWAIGRYESKGPPLGIWPEAE